ncbi:MAG: Nitrate reductase-like protein NarX [Acidimicrobiales bacterium]|nr:MAG: respiratory nitrate reductase subunit gamma [Actinomycetota bacterium]MBV6510121.1 Nitrate reductase-like protein NarX [Acidimicrobiales bacterium]RIK05766.1 MAG: respiratory nitrate reductase subunit gamma [Acidobacteriota bacterium]
MLDQFLLIAIPYMAVLLAVLGGLYRYYSDRFSYSSQSSEFLESRTLFWGSVPWHYGIIIILLAHLLVFLLPGLWKGIIGEPSRLYVFEVMGFSFALLTIIGLSALIVRRFSFRRIMIVTSPMDWLLLALLLAQVVLGAYVALFYRWGAEWGAYKAAPWLASLVKFQPDIGNVATLPWIVKLHLIGGFLIIAIFPFTRLVHLVTFPLSYLWRPRQVVIWNRKREKVRIKA